MSKLYKKIVAVLLVVTMLVSNTITCFAAENTSAEQNLSESQSSETKQAENQQPENKQPEQLIQQNNNSTPQPTENSNSQNKVEKPSILVNYIVLVESNIYADTKQSILVGIGDGQSVIKTAKITIRNTSSNRRYSYDACNVLDDAVLFKTDIATSIETGIYEVEKIEYTVGDYSYEVDVSTTGITAKFGVNTNYSSKADAYVTEGDERNNITPDCFDVKSDSSEEVKEIRASYASNGKIVIVLDPGHGGTDAGAVRTYWGNTYCERDINLKIAEYCKEVLERNSSIEVYMTRTDNTSPLMDRQQRLQFAKDRNANFFVSFHINATSATGPQETSRGAEIYIPNENYNIICHTVSENVSNRIISNLSALGLVNRGVKVRNATDGGTYPDGSLQDYLGINYWGKIQGIPAILIEHFFINSASDLSLAMGSEDSLRALGEADAKGILDSLGDIVSYDAIFDATYYADNNADLKNAYGYDYNALLSHFINHGMSEGRQGNSEFNVYSYRNQYGDLRRGYGSDLKAYYMHYLYHGKKEGRQGTGCNILQDALTVLNGEDYSSVYDYNFYKNNYDLYRAYGENERAMLEHFVYHGMSEGRQGNSNFDVYSYRLQYGDLRRGYGNDLKAYYLHYMYHGIYEGRQGTGCTTLQGATTVLGGVDYSAVYDFNYYKNNPDLYRAFGENEYAMLEHFVYHGMSEGRQGNSSFNVKSYRLQYGDLRRGYGNDLKQYYLHYMYHGIREGRQGTGCTTLQNPLTVLNGVDYSPVYDYNYYKNNPDLYRAYGENEYAMLEHFVYHGMSEGRIGSLSFNVFLYRDMYGDLRRGYGDNLKAYYEHYLFHGLLEGRSAVNK